MARERDDDDNTEDQVRHVQEDVDNDVQPTVEDSQDQDQEQDDEKPQVDPREKELRKTKRLLSREKNKNRQIQSEIARIAQERKEDRELLNRVMAGQTASEQDQLKRGANDIENYFTTAQRNMSAAIGSGNPDLIAQAVDQFTDAKLRREQLRLYMQQQAAQPTQTERQGKSEDGPRETRAAREWRRENSWYNDEDSMEETWITSAIDKSLSSDPDWADDIGSGEYMDELTRRVKKRLPHLFDETDEDDRSQRRSVRQQPQRQQARQTVAGSPMGRQGAKPRVDPRTIEMARDLGKPVDDPKYMARLQKQAEAVQRNKVR